MILVWHIAKQHSYENMVRLLPCLRKRQTRRPASKLHSHKPQCDSPIVPPFHLPTIEVINKIGGPEVDDLHAADMIIAQGKKTTAQVASTPNIHVLQLSHVCISLHYHKKH